MIPFLSASFLGTLFPQTISRQPFFWAFEMGQEAMSSRQNRWPQMAHSQSFSSLAKLGISSHQGKERRVGNGELIKICRQIPPGKTVTFRTCRASRSHMPPPENGRSRIRCDTGDSAKVAPGTAQQCLRRYLLH